MQRVAAEVAQEVGVLLQHQRFDAGAREQQAEHHAGGAAAGDDDLSHRISGRVLTPASCRMPRIWPVKSS